VRAKFDVYVFITKNEENRYPETEIKGNNRY